MDTPIQGRVEPGFEALSEIFRGNWTPGDGDPGELGAALNISVDGRVVVDLWGGWRDRARTLVWQRDTLVNAYSVGKALSATAVLSLVAEGRLDLDTPLRTYWPEFTSGATLRQALSHRAGLPCARSEVGVDEALDFHTMAGILAATEPWWEPGTAHGYHVNTLGHIIGEPACRVTGEDFGAIVERIVAVPHGADIHLGLPDASQSRLAEIDFPVAERFAPSTGDPAPPAPSERDTTGEDDPQPDASGVAEADLVTMRAGAYFNPPELSGIGAVNTAAFRRAQIPSTNMACTAEGVTRVFAALSGHPLDGTAEILPASLLDEATTTHSEGYDLILERDSRFGLGFMLHRDDRPIGISDESFGHFGHGGSLGFADRRAGVAFCFLTNRPGDRWQMPRTRRLVDGLRRALS